MEELKYTYSQLYPSSVGQLISSQYDLPEITDCKLYILGLHDNYLIECGHKKYILRVYRNDWRTPEDIQFELELLVFLDHSKSGVAAPLCTKDEKYSFVIRSPEGERTGVLFHYAEGHAPGNSITVEQSILLGESVARIHQVSDRFESSGLRQVLDIPYLLDESIQAIKPFINKESCEYLDGIKLKIHANIPCLSQDPGQFGICIGDVNPTNFHINESNRITLFDFDQCGYGHRAFEIGKFISSLHPITTKEHLSQAFIKGYQQYRKLSDEEQRSIPYYELVSVIWVMAIHVYNVDRIGFKYLEKPFWDRKFEILRELEQHLSGL